MKHFWLIRHAKSAHSIPGTDVSDFDRDLNPRGRRDGEQMQRWFAQLAADQPEYRPDWLVTSTAVRAAATSQFVVDGFALGTDQSTSDSSLYHAGPELVLDVLRSTPADATCAALVAHNPGLTWLVNALTDSSAAIDNLPTLGCALFHSDAQDWTDITRARRLLLMTPKTLSEQ